MHGYSFSFAAELHQSAVNKKKYQEPPAVLVELIEQTASLLTPWSCVERRSFWFYKAFSVTAIRLRKRQPGRWQTCCSPEWSPSLSVPFNEDPPILIESSCTPINSTALNPSSLFYPPVPHILLLSVSLFYSSTVLIAWRSLTIMWQLIRNPIWCHWFYTSLCHSAWFPGNYWACYLLISRFTEHHTL